MTNEYRLHQNLFFCFLESLDSDPWEGSLVFCYIFVQAPYKDLQKIGSKINYFIGRKRRKLV